MCLADLWSARDWQGNARLQDGTACLGAPTAAHAEVGPGLFGDDLPGAGLSAGSLYLDRDTQCSGALLLADILTFSG